THPDLHSFPTRRSSDLEPVRAFPLSSPRHGVSVCDAEGRELFWIDDLDALPADLRKILEDELRRREFVPVLRRIWAVSAVEPSRSEEHTSELQSPCNLV